MPRESAGVDERIDTLIPAPWPAWRRTLVVVGLLGLAAGLVAATLSGLAGPRLAHADAWGADIDAADPERLVVARTVPIRNDGWLAARLESFEPDPLDDVAWLDVDGLPVTLQPGETREVTVRLEVAGCDVDVEGYDVFAFRARGGLAPSRITEVSARHSSDPNRRATYATEDGDVELPVWPDQQPSWILDAIAAPCQSPPDDS